jgi:hypothetical protein
MVSASLASLRSSSMTFSLPGKISYLAFQPFSGSMPMRVTSCSRDFCWRWVTLSSGDILRVLAACAARALVSISLPPPVGKITDMTDRGLHYVVLAQVLIDGFGLGRRLYDNEGFAHMPSDCRHAERGERRIQRRMLPRGCEYIRGKTGAVKLKNTTG